MRLAAVGTLGLAACGADTDLRPRTLEFVRTIVAPDLEEETAWLARPNGLRRDTVSGHLLSTDFVLQVVSEFGTDGVLVRTYGRHGAGPGEIRNIGALAITSRALAVLDVGNGKIVVYDRADGAPLTEFPVRRFVSDITSVGDTLLALLPGTDGAAFDLHRWDGERVGSFGDGALIPENCSNCHLRDLGDGRLVVVFGDRWEGRFLRLDGALEGAFGFHEMREVIARWEQEFRERLGRIGMRVAEGEAGRVPTGKVWIPDVEVYAPGAFYVTVTPERVQERPWEVWFLDGEGRVTGRHRFPRTWVGSRAAGFPSIYAVGRRDAAGVHEYRVQ